MEQTPFVSIGVRMIFRLMSQNVSLKILIRCVTNCFSYLIRDFPTLMMKTLQKECS
jgi:hypothetical protein